MIATVTITVFCTLFLVFLGMNLSTPEKKLERRTSHLYSTADAQFRREMSVLFGPSIVSGNEVTPLQNGIEIFPAMLSAIAEATTTICFETFIYWSGSVGRRFAEALSERARAGVRVHVLLDWVGSTKMDSALLETMQEAGVEVHRYRPLRFYNLGRMNNRTHRKLLIVDGRVGFTGGVGIADQWDGNAENPEHWRDIHFRIAGPVVSQFQGAFNDNWIKTTGRVLNGPTYFPEVSPQGAFDAQLFLSSPSGGSESMHLMYLMSIAAASRSIDIQAAYFVPDRLLIDALISAAERGWL